MLEVGLGTCGIGSISAMSPEGGDACTRPAQEVVSSICWDWDTLGVWVWVWVWEWVWGLGCGAWAVGLGLLGLLVVLHGAGAGAGGKADLRRHGDVRRARLVATLCDEQIWAVGRGLGWAQSHAHPLHTPPSRVPACVLPPRQPSTEPPNIRPQL